MKGVSSHLLPSYLDERMWRDRWGTTGDNAFTNILIHISEQYPVLKWYLLWTWWTLYNSSASTLYCECDVIIHKSCCSSKIIKNVMPSTKMYDHYKINKM